jgi:hypothetical protein
VQKLANRIDTVVVDSLKALDLNGRLEKRKSHGLFDHIAIGRQLELEHGAFRYVR